MKEPDAVRVGQLVCDFCAVPGPTIEFPCDDIEVMQEITTPTTTGAKTFQQGSDGSWLACEPCHRAVLRARGAKGGARGLAVYVARKVSRRENMPKSFRRQIVEPRLESMYRDQVLPLIRDPIPYVGPSHGVVSTVKAIQRKPKTIPEQELN